MILRASTYMQRFFRSILVTLDLKFTKSIHANNAMVTAFDSSHYLSARQLLESVYLFSPKIDVHIFDLGLSDSELQSISVDFPNCVVHAFDFSLYPKYFDIKVNAGQYAWKPVIVSYMLNSQYDHIFWLDAGDKLIGNFDNLEKLTDRYGFFAVPTSNTIKELTHVNSIVSIGVSEQLCEQLQLSAAFIGFCLRNPAIRQLVTDWAYFAKTESVISPANSSRENHRQDQSIFNLLLVRHDDFRQFSNEIISRKFLPKHHKILTHQDIDFS
jgi:hypothetical protein